MYTLTKFRLQEMTACGAALRKLGIGAQSMEDAANRVVHYLHKQFVDEETGESAFALVRLFKTHTYAELVPSLREAADAMLAGQRPTPDMKCLVLMATTGMETAWNSRQSSNGHQAIPLTSSQMVAQSPMISQLIQQMGLEINTVLSPDSNLMIDLEQQTYNVFHVAEAVGSPYIPAQQEFVIPYGIQSVLGFGGMLPSGNLMAVILFSKVAIARETADLFKTLSLNAKMALLPFDQNLVFAA